MPLIDCHNHIGAELRMYLEKGFPYGQQLINMVAEGAAVGVTHWIVFPMVANLSLNIGELMQGRVTTEGGVERVPYQWENRRMLEEIQDLFATEGKNVIPFVMFDPSRETEAQAKALRELKAEHNFYGLKVQPTMIESPIVNLRKQGRVFLELAEEWNIPMLIHSSVLPADIWSQASDIIDIAAEWPQVRFCVAHSCRMDATQLDRIAELPNTWFDPSAHCIHCDLAVENSPVVAPVERRFKSDFTRPEQVLADMAAAYPGKMIWGSDSPYYSYVARVEGTLYRLISSYEREMACVNYLSEEVRREVTHTNTEKFLGFEIK